MITVHYITLIISFSHQQLIMISFDAKRLNFTYKTTRLTPSNFIHQK